MWFEARKALAELVGGHLPPAAPTPATTTTIATNPRPAVPRVAVVASVAAPQAQKPNENREVDAGQLADLLARSGPLTYGAAASALGWGATRAWQAEAFLRVSGRVQFDAWGRATITDGNASFRTS